jgi:hypothetical protein
MLLIRSACLSVHLKSLKVRLSMIKSIRLVKKLKHFYGSKKGSKMVQTKL